MGKYPKSEEGTCGTMQNRSNLSVTGVPKDEKSVMMKKVFKNVVTINFSILVKD